MRSESEWCSYPLNIPLKIKIFLALLIPLIITLIILSTVGTNLINTGVTDVARDQEASLANQISYRLSDALDHYPYYLRSVIPDVGRDNTDIAQIQQYIDLMNQSGMDLIFDQGV
jgi:hypothetical protein